MLPPNRAAALLRRIHKETLEQAPMSLLLPFIAQALVPLGLGVLFLFRMALRVYAAGLILGETLLAGVLIATMARLDGIIVGELARAGFVEAARQPAGWYQEREWRIVRAEQ